MGPWRPIGLLPTSRGHSADRGRLAPLDPGANGFVKSELPVFEHDSVLPRFQGKSLEGRRALVHPVNGDIGPWPDVDVDVSH